MGKTYLTDLKSLYSRQQRQSMKWKTEWKLEN